MAETQDTNTPQLPQGYSFGGETPAYPTQPTGETFAMVNPDEQPQDTYEMASRDDARRPALQGEDARRKVAKMQFAMGPDAPSQDTLETMLRDGREQEVRENYAKLEDGRDQEAKVSLIKSLTSNGIPQNPNALQVLQKLVEMQPKNDPNTVVEKAFAKAYTNVIPQLKEGNNPVAEGYAKEPDHVETINERAQKLVEIQEVLKSVAEHWNHRVKDMGWANWGVHLAAEFVPGLNTWQVNAADPAVSMGDVLTGNKWERVVNTILNTGDPSKVYELMHQYADQLAIHNPLLAKEFTEYAVSFTANDTFLKNLGTGLDVGTAIPLGAAWRFGKVVTKGVAEGAPLKETITQGFKEAVKANAPVNTTMEDMLSRLGDTDTAVRVSVGKDVLKNGGELPKDIPVTNQDVARQLPSVMNPWAARAENSNLSAISRAKVVEFLDNNQQKFVDRVRELLKVARLPDEALDVAFKEAQEALKNQYKHVNDAIIDFRHVRPESVDENVGYVIASLGRKDGTMFDSQMEAYNWGKGIYKLDDEVLNTKFHGSGWTIEVPRALDETSPGVRSVLISTGNKTPATPGISILGWLRSGTGKLSRFQNENRLVAQHSQSALSAVLKDTGDVISSLNKGERSRILRVMEDNKTTYNPKTEAPGIFHDTFREFEDNFMRLNGQWPTEKEVKAYFTFVANNDAEYWIRNMELYKYRATGGYQNISIRHKMPTEDGAGYYFPESKFLGKQHDKLPLDQSNKKEAFYDATVAIHRSGEEPEVLRLSELKTPERREYIQKLQDEGYKIIETHNPSRGHFGGAFGEDPINFFVTKDLDINPLHPVQLPYRPGWHQIYDQQYFVKQPKIRAVERVTGTPDVKEGLTRPTRAITHHVYEGDTTAMGFYTKAEAQKYAMHWENARQILNGEKPGDLADYLAKNLPFDAGQFRKFFEPNAEGVTRYSKEVPFVHTFTGETTTDAHRNLLESKFANLQDTIRSPWNGMAREDKKFVGQRDEPLLTVKEGKDTERNPTFQIDQAPQIDPMAAVAKAMSNILRNRYINDYKLTAVESWIQEFGHLLNVSKEDLATNGVAILHQPTWIQKNSDNAAAIQQAMQARSAIMEFLGTQSPFKMQIESIKQNLASSVYRTLGQDASNWLTTKFLTAEADPTRFMRSLAFHETIGLFNPFQAWQNAQTMANAVAYGGVHGAPGFVAGLMMQGARYTANPAVLDRLATAAEKASGGAYKADWFKEAWAEFKKTGRGVVEGEHAWRDNLADPNLVEGAFGKFLDKSQIFFRGGERAIRMVAYSIAYREWRAAHAYEELTDAARRSILMRSDDMTANMTRASQATWQTGIFSVPSQFLGYNARIMEQFISKDFERFSVGDRVRLFGTMSLLYGLPIGVSLPVIGVWDPYKDIRKAALDRGYTLDSKVWDTVHNGVMGLAASIITGRPNTIAERSSPGGNSFLRDTFFGDKNTVKQLMSAAGGKTWDTLASVAPIWGDLVQTAQGKGDPALYAADIMDLLRNISSVDNTYKAYYGYNLGKWITKNGTYPGDINAQEALLGWFTGGTNRNIGDQMLKQDAGKDREAMIQDATKNFTKYYTMAIDALNTSPANRQLYEAARAKAHAYAVAAGMRDDEIAKLITKVYDENKQKGWKIHYDYATTQAPRGRTDARWQAHQSNPYGIKE